MANETKRELQSLGPAAPGQARHTPGPWKLRQSMKYGPGSTQDRVNWVPDPGRFDIAGPDGDMPMIVEDVWEPDARLIAAAPVLAAALETIANEAGDTGRNLAWARLHARAALRLAGRLP